MSVNGQRKRLFFETEAAAQEALRNLEIKARRQGQAGLDMPDALRAMAVDCARQLKPHGKTIADATAFLLHHLAAEQSAQVDALVDDYLRALERGRLSAKHLETSVGVLAGFGKLLGSVQSAPFPPASLRSGSMACTWTATLRQPQTIVNWRAALNAFFGMVVAPEAGRLQSRRRCLETEGRS